MSKTNKKSDDPGRKRQGGLGIAARNPRNSTTSSSTVSSSSSSSISNRQTLSSSSTSKTKNDYHPTNEDRIELLKSSKSKGGRFRITKPQKVEMLKNVFDNRENILQVIRSVDKEDKTGLQRRFHQLIFLIDKKNKRSRASAEDLATWLISLHDIFSTTIHLRRDPLRNP